MKPSANDPNKLRLQVFLSRNGICSRRRAMDMVKQGHVALNGQVCREPSVMVDSRRDRVSVDGRDIKAKAYTYVLLHKPAGYTATRSDPHAHRTVLDLLPEQYRHLSPVGRLDKETEGLLLLTNDGDTAYRLTHPKFNVEKVYFARIHGRLSAGQKKLLESGIVIDGVKTAPAAIKDVRLAGDKTELMITIHEGRKRQIRHMFDKIGHLVIYLKRLRQGPLNLGPLKKGQWRLLTPQEIQKIAEP